MYHILLICSVDGHWGGFWFWTIRLRLLWTFLNKSFCGHVSTCLRNRIAGSLGRGMFNSVRNCQRVFQSGHSSYFIFPWHYMRVPVASCSHWRLVLSAFLISAILMGVAWHLIVVCICISLLTDDVEYPFTCSLHIHTYSFVRYLFKCFANLKTVLLVFFKKLIEI